MHKDYIDLGRKMDHSGCLSSIKEEKVSEIYYPSIYLSNLDGLEVFEMSEEEQTVTAKIRVTRKTVTIENDGDKSCSIEIDILGIKPNKKEVAAKTEFDKDKEVFAVMDSFMNAWKAKE